MHIHQNSYLYFITAIKHGMSTGVLFLNSEMSPIHTRHLIHTQPNSYPYYITAIKHGMGTGVLFLNSKMSPIHTSALVI